VSVRKRERERERGKERGRRWVEQMSLLVTRIEPINHFTFRHNRASED